MKFVSNSIINSVKNLEGNINALKAITVDKNGTRKKTVSFWDKLKFLYYNFKYQLAYRKLEKNMSDSMTDVCVNPRHFIFLLTELVSIVASLSEYIVDDINEFLKRKFKSFGMDYSPLSINFTIEKDANGKRVVKYKIITKYKPISFKRGEEEVQFINDGNIVKTIVDVDVVKMICNVESIYYNTDIIDQANDRAIIKRKSYAIAPDGSVDNYYFVFDKNLKKKEIKNYSKLALFTISPFIIFLTMVCKLEFKLVNLKPKYV